MPRKPRAPTKTFQVLRDSREQDEHGWTFPANESEGILGTTVRGLPTGDYTLVGFESVLCLERKGSTGEFAQNVCQDRFERELERMRAFPVRFVVLEFTLDDLWNFPANSGIPRSRWRFLRTTREFLLKRLVELSSTYDTPFVPCGRLGREFALSVFKRVVCGDLPAPQATNGPPETPESKADAAPTQPAKAPKPRRARRSDSQSDS
jgi:hypothetical protein